MQRVTVIKVAAVALGDHRDGVLMSESPSVVELDWLIVAAHSPDLTSTWSPPRPPPPHPPELELVTGIPKDITETSLVTFLSTSDRSTSTTCHRTPCS